MKKQRRDWDGGRGNNPWTPEELAARERLVELVTERPGLTGKELWQVWDSRPSEWEVWDVTGVLLDLVLTPPARIRESSVDGGWRFWAVEGVDSGVGGSETPRLALDTLPTSKRRIKGRSTPRAGTVRRKP